MKLIFENPYRILGLSITATDREIEKRVSDLSVYAEMGKTVYYDYDFVDFAPLERNIESIMDAERKLERPINKLLHSLFWISFDNINNFIKDLNINNRLEIINNIPNNNAFDLHNKAIITLFSKNDFYTLQTGITHFNNFLIHPGLNEFVKKITGERSSTDYDIDEIFIEEILNDLKGKYEPKEILELFKNTLKENYLKSKLLKPYIHKIESEIEIAKNKTEASQINANEHCNKLIIQTKESLRSLKSFLQDSDIQFTSISNKLAEQILDCAIVYFNNNNITDSQRAAKNSIRLIEIAKNYIYNNDRLLKRTIENITTIQDWLFDNNYIEDGDTQYDSVNSYDFLLHNINKANRKSQGFIFSPEQFLQIADNLMSYEYRLHLNKISEEVGKEYPTYIGLSSKLVNAALNVIIKYFNYIKRENSLNNIQKEKILKLFAKIYKLDFDKKTEERIQKNYIIIQGYEKFINYKEFKQNQNGKKEEDFSAVKEKYKGNYENHNNPANKGCVIIAIVAIIILVVVYITIGRENKNIILKKTNDLKGNIEKYNKPTINKKEMETIIFPKQELKDIKPIKPLILKKYEPICLYKGNQLKNGTSPYNQYFGYGIYDKEYLNEITFKNGYKTDAIVCLVNRYTGKVIRNEYIRKDTNFKMTNIPNGTYYLKVFSGNDWNPEKTMANGRFIGGFETNMSFSVSDNIEDLLVVEDDGYKYTVGSITLYRVDYGNMESKPINEEEFFK